MMMQQIPASAGMTNKELFSINSADARRGTMGKSKPKS